MTYEEAIKIVKNNIHNDYTWVIVESIEKQIPKKPELWHNQPYPPEWADDDWGYRCPACGNEDIDYPEHHCMCGQALDWSDIE